MTEAAAAPTADFLPVARLRLTARAEAPLLLPAYAGSMLRGAFGHALLALSPLPHEDGKPCRLQATCPYCQLFAKGFERINLAASTHILEKGLERLYEAIKKEYPKFCK